MKDKSRMTQQGSQLRPVAHAAWSSHFLPTIWAWKWSLQAWPVAEP